MVQLRYGAQQEDLALLQGKVHLPSVRQMFSLQTVELNGRIEPADANGLTYSTFTETELIVVTGTAGEKLTVPCMPAMHSLAMHLAHSMSLLAPTVLLPFISHACHAAGGLTVGPSFRAACEVQPDIIPSLSHE